MLTCFRVRRRLGAYLDGALEEGRAHVVATHVAGCARCQQDADALRRLHLTLRESLAVPAPTDWTGFWPGIVRGIQDHRPERLVRRRAAWQGPRRLWRPRLAFGGALAAALLVSVGIWQLTSPVAPEGGVIVRSVDTDLPGGSVMVYAPPERDLAVVWVFGD